METMSKTEVVRAAWDAYAAGDVERAFQFLSPEITWYPASDHPGARRHHGHEELRVWLGEIANAFSTYRMTVLGVQDLGDYVLAHGLLYAEQDGEPVIDRVTVWRCTVEDGLIMRVDADAMSGPSDEPSRWASHGD
jgi:ketosteroid isomerase-like protein